VVAPAEVTLLMRTLADPTRRAIYERIVSEREATVGALTCYARVSQPAVSQHLKALQGASLIVGRRDGRNMFYRAKPRGLSSLAGWMQQYEQFWSESFDRLDDYLKELKGKEQHARKKR
jgi:DNA-binding transcriptional ArsR family regulator